MVSGPWVPVIPTVVLVKNVGLPQVPPVHCAISFAVGPPLSAPVNEDVYAFFSVVITCDGAEMVYDNERLLVWKWSMSQLAPKVSLVLGASTVTATWLAV